MASTPPRRRSASSTRSAATSSSSACLTPIPSPTVPPSRCAREPSTYPVPGAVTPDHPHPIRKPTRRLQPPLFFPSADPRPDPRPPLRVRAPRPQAAATRALEAGTTLDQVIDLVARVTPDVSAPIVLFTYYNPIYQRGFEPFVKKIAAAGAKGLLVPDIPLEETGELSAVCKANGLDLVLLSTPTTPEERMAKIAEKSNGFIHLVSVTGVTGVRSGVESRVEGLVKSLKSVTDKPVAVGFGISKREQAAEVVQWVPTASSSDRRWSRRRGGEDPGGWPGGAQGARGGSSGRGATGRARSPRGRAAGSSRGSWGRLE